ncbi:Membrane protein involved in the export of O-antigen and teichoic acid [Arenibacter nanhaiticus]|uniref:Membrane protein involved in the export of O-antigen and teichoic acid n=1 Tax=Arenibacter nanhaiticus TaxID=558155 RepID=A0A1M6A670_9FLAO|nr:oligosaccharide flippase family protein [Arenibacter nanhaiticus]SHI31970.1 Membrane protein involved in the export of O-antigen and teichoic acid [Arenibacter nanhaiticus]
MNPLKKLFKHTFIYGMATVLPRMLSFLLLPLYTEVLETAGFGEVSIIFSWFAIFNVVLAYGMETAFFRFYSNAVDKAKVVSTSLITIGSSTFLFLLLALSFQDSMAKLTNIDAKYIQYAIYILALDALVIIPFAWLRANEAPMRYALVKMANVVLNFGLNILFLLVLPKMAVPGSDAVWNMLYRPDFEISYIFIANLIASGSSLLLMSDVYFKSSYRFDRLMWKKMMKYAFPVLIAGLAYSVNEVFDKIMLSYLLPANIADSEIGKYAGCYRLAMFMTLFATAFRMGIEPFFFSHSSAENPQRTYAQITNYFVVFGSIILLGVVVFADTLKVLLVRNEDYWEAMPVVPMIVLASFCLGIYHNLSVWYKVTDRTKVGAYISIVGAVLTIIINYAFIPLYGYMASAVATLVAYAVMMLLSFSIGQRYYPIPYDLRKILFYLLVSIGFSVLSFYVFDRNLIVGIVLLLLYLGLVYSQERVKLKQLFVKK